MTGYARLAAAAWMALADPSLSAQEAPVMLGDFPSLAQAVAAARAAKLPPGGMAQAWVVDTAPDGAPRRRGYMVSGAGVQPLPEVRQAPTATSHAPSPIVVPGIMLPGFSGDNQRPPQRDEGRRPR